MRCNASSSEEDFCCKVWTEDAVIEVQYDVQSSLCVDVVINVKAIFGLMLPYLKMIVSIKLVFGVWLSSMREENLGSVDLIRAMCL